METTTDTLVILAEVTTAFVAFAAIVASLRMTLGQELTPFQKLLIHFFTESGMAAVSIAIFPLILFGFFQDQTVVAKYTIWYTLLVSGAYLVYYIRRRLRIKAPTPIPSLLVMIGYAVWLPILGVFATDMIWEPSLAIVAAFCFWALFSGVVIFISFLATFVDQNKPSTY